jgi:hypothetical protein
MNGCRSSLGSREAQKTEMKLKTSQAYSWEAVALLPYAMRFKQATKKAEVKCEADYILNWN